MNDPKLLRSDPARARKAAADRGGKTAEALERALVLDGRVRALLQEVEALRSKRNESSKAIGAAKAAKDEAKAATLMAEVAELKTSLPAKEAELAPLDGELKDILLGLPHFPHESVPVGHSEADNRVLRSDPEPAAPAFAPKDHAALGEALGLMDFAAGAKLGGSRFSVLKGPLARLHRAISQFMLDTHTRKNGYTEMWVPYLVRGEVLQGTGQLPKFEEDLYKTATGPAGDEAALPLYLIPTSEVPLTNLVRESILDEAQLPMKLTALTPCFRQEAGSYGKDVKGLIRQHQFDKVELVWITKPEDSMSALEDLTAHAAGILKDLGLPHRVLELCTGDIGFSAMKTYDLEVWFPAEKRWREASSCSNCGDFQARRMNARFRRGPKGSPEFVHTLNGSGLAVGRVFAAILENYQREDGSITVPAALTSYFGGDVISSR
ncbi:MAG: seryl-tRNA synthetase [Elusimicrobia bacterium]|nr:MAG: seryl-tRNA synthetase [Elusimicrobiota bacterium]